MSHQGRSRARSFGPRGGGGNISGRGPQSQQQYEERGGGAAAAGGGGGGRGGQMEEETRSQFSQMSMQRRGAGHGRVPMGTEFSGASGGGSSRGGSRYDERSTSSGAGPRDYRMGRGRSGPGGDRPSFTNYPESEMFPIIRASDIPCGESGRRIEVLANYYKMSVKPIMVYQHDINFTFKDEEEKKKIGDNEKLQKYFSKNNDILFEAFATLNESLLPSGRYVWDYGKNIFSTENFEHYDFKKEISAIINGKKQQYRVECKMVQKIDFSLILEYYEKKMSIVPEVVVHFLELLIKSVSTQKFYIHNRSYFDASNNLINSPKEWIKFSQGFIQSIRLTEIGPAMNIHLKTSCMISPSVETLEQLVFYVSDGHDPAQLSEGDIGKVNRIIRGLKAYTTHTGRKMFYTLKGLYKKPKECMFSVKENGDQDLVSVHDYFAKKYNLDVKNYPTVAILGKKELLIPLELCFMVEKQFLNNSKIDSQIQNDLLHVSTHKPVIYFNNLTRYSREILELDRNLMCDEMGTDFVPKPVRFFARVLDAPEQKGGRKTDMFYSTPNRPEYAFFSFDRSMNNRDCEQFVNDLKRSGKKYGLDLSNCLASKCIEIDSKSLSEAEKMANVFINILCRFSEIKLLFIAIPQVSWMYNLVKHFGDQKHGIVTQCLNTSKAKNRRGGYIDNVLLKVNGKMGGTNSIIIDSELKKFPFDYTKTMLIGIDVTHPGQTEKVESSIAAAVGSYDHYFTKYSASIRVQKKNRDEIIDCLQEMIKELLEEYRKFNKYFPENLIVFRDGVSDGQFQYAESEIKQVKMTLRECGIKNGKVIFIVTQKGHHTRFVLSKPSGPSERATYNVPSGTIVDNTIVEPSQDMFFLNSHFSPLGTSKPLKYVVLHNDFERRVLSNDDLQKLCFYSCHNCTRFRNGAIAMPTPIRYADLCAYRSKLHLDAQRNRNFTGDGSLEERVIACLNTAVKVNESCKNRLFYA